MGKQRIADYIADFLAVRGFDTVFTVVGGGAMHLNDAFGASKHLKDIHHHHEQAVAMAAKENPLSSVSQVAQGARMPSQGYWGRIRTASPC